MIYAAIAAAAVALLAAHGAILRFLAAHASLSLAVVVALGGAIAMLHLRLLGPAYGALRRYLHRGR